MHDPHLKTRTIGDILEQLKTAGYETFFVQEPDVDGQPIAILVATGDSAHNLATMSQAALRDAVAAATPPDPALLLQNEANNRAFRRLTRQELERAFTTNGPELPFDRKAVDRALTRPMPRPFYNGAA